MPDRRTLVQRTFRRYQQADRQRRSLILDEFVESTRYARAYAALVLRKWGATSWAVGPRGPLRLVAGAPPRQRHPAKRIYGDTVAKALIRLWYLCDCMCGKRLVPAIRALLAVYQHWGELKVSPAVRRKLLSISAATADRLLRDERRKLRTDRGRSHTHRAATTLLRQIPLRTFDEWDRSLLGQVQADLVGHDGGLNQGEFAFTCTVVELCVGWNELRVLPNKARLWVREALDDIRSHLPFPIVALGTDTGSEFINEHLFVWSEEHHISFSRARPYRKNDNCYVEEKNNSLVRRTVGYLRYDTPEEREILQAIYQRQLLLSNYYYPCMKLVDKSRYGARVYRKYDTPRTPCQPLLERGDVPQEVKEQLKKTFQHHNPAVLKRELTKLQNRLYMVASAKPAPILHKRGKPLAIRNEVRLEYPVRHRGLPKLEFTVRQ